VGGRVADGAPLVRLLCDILPVPLECPTILTLPTFSLIFLFIPNSLFLISVLSDSKIGESREASPRNHSRRVIRSRAASMGDISGRLE